MKINSSPTLIRTTRYIAAIVSVINKFWKPIRQWQSTFAEGVKIGLELNKYIM